MKKLGLAVSAISLGYSIAFALALVPALGGLACAATPAVTSNDEMVPPVSNPAARQLVSNAHDVYKKGNVALAITLLKKAVAIVPKDGVVRALLGRILLQSGDPASAERELRQARGDGAPEHFVMPTLYRAMLARHEEQKLLDEFPDPPSKARGDAVADVLRGRAAALLALGHTDDAAAAMDRSLSLRRDVSGLLGRAHIATQQNNPSLAKNLTNEAMMLEPKNGHALTAKLRILVDSNDLAGALALSEQILKQFPNDISSRSARIEIFFKLKQDDKAKAEIAALQSKAPGRPVSQYYQARLLARANDFTGAWRIAQALPPQFIQSEPSVALQVSQMAVSSGNVETGLAILAATLAKSPDQLNVRLRLADLRMSQNSPEGVLAVLLAVKDSHDPHALDLLAQAYLKLGKYSEAAGILKKMQSTDSKRAIALVISALRLEPSSAEMMDALGWIKLQQKDTKGAIELLTRAHKMRPESGVVTFDLVQALDASGDRNSAKSLLKSLLDSGTNFEDLPKARQLSASWR